LLLALQLRLRCALWSKALRATVFSLLAALPAALSRSRVLRL
jgi:hypothetical protein